MPTTHTYSRSVDTHYEFDELPKNVLLYLKELKDDGYNITFTDYYESVDKEDNEKDSGLYLELNVDAEDKARSDKYSTNGIKQEYHTIQKILNIGDVIMRMNITNKENFAKKILTGLKKHLKESYVGKAIHQIRFDTKKDYLLEIKIIRKQTTLYGYRRFSDDEHVYDRDIKKVARDYLDNLGYTNLNVEI